MNSDQKAIMVMEIKKNDRVYALNLPIGAPYGEVYDVLFSMLQDVLELAQQAAQKAAPKDMQAQELQEAIDQANKPGVA